MDIRLLPIDYKNMTWKDVFETFQANIDTLYNAILGSYTDVEVEQFLGPATSVIIESPVDEDTEWLIFRNNDFLGKRDGGTGYVVEGQVITFNEPLTQDDRVTVLITNGNGIAVLANKYIAEIKRMYDSLKDLDIDITKQIENVTSLKSFLDESANNILDAKNIAATYLDYIRQLIEGTTPDHGDFADEIVAARRQYPLIGTRLDTFLSKTLEKQTFLDSTDYRDGDWVMVRDSTDLHIFMVKDSYSGLMPYERMTYGQYAVKIFSTDDYAPTQELTDRVTRLENEIIDHEDRIKHLEEVIAKYESRVLMDLKLTSED